jgi:hypothetical protein
MPIDRSNLVSEVLNGDDRTVEALQPVLQYLKELQLEKNKDLLELTSTKLWLSTRQGMRLMLCLDPVRMLIIVVWF